MTTVYVAMINDRHADPEPFVFSTARAAIDYAKKAARENGHFPEDFEEPEVPDGWLYYATYSVEDDDVWVIEKQIDEAG